MAEPSQRAEAGRALLQAALLMGALWLPKLGLDLHARLTGSPDVIVGMLWCAAAIVPLALLFALTVKGSLTDRALRAGQFAILVVGLWLLFLAVGQFAA